MSIDRRRHERLAIHRPCKVFHWPTQRYLPARTCNASAGGALLMVDSPRPVGVEDPLDLLIAWDDRPILGANDQVRGRVVRSTDAPDGSQVLAIEFDRAVADRALAA